jgi:transposase
VTEARRVDPSAITAHLGVSPKTVAAIVLGRSHQKVLPGHLDRVACVRAEVRRLRVTLRAVYHWVATYGRDHAPAALADRGRTGRPRLLTPADRESLRELLDCSPQGMGYFAAQWTVPLLREHLTRRTGRPFSDDTLRRELQRLRYSWKRSRYTLDPDPELGGKKEAHPAATPAIAGT